MLDAARSLLLSGGSRHATIEAIASATGAPTGSIYHQFGSRDELIAKLWMRAIYRSQASFIAALEHEDPHTAALNAAMSVVTFCEQYPDDARLVVSFRREDLIQATPDSKIVEELKELNRPIERAVANLAERIYGQRTRETINRTLFAVFDIPYGAVRRYLIAGEELPPGLHRDLPKAITAVLDSP
jgi:AcrR family transcriptional regulator